MMRRLTKNEMPGWPVPENKRIINLELDSKIVEHLDQQAASMGCSRSFYVRQLFLNDMKRLKPALVVV